MIPYHRLASKLFNQPLMVTESVALTVSDFLLSRIDARRGGSDSSDMPIEEVQYIAPTTGPSGTTLMHSPRATRFVGDYAIAADGRPLPYRRTEDGKAIVTMVGELVNRGAWVGASSGLISYEGFKHQMYTAAADPKSRVILLDTESPGGEAVGCNRASEVVREVAAEKPVIAIVNASACSAMYSLISGSTRIYTLREATMLSIGVLALHLDLSEMLKGAGVKPTFVFCGARKVDGNPYEKLPDEVRDRWKAHLERYYGMFVETVNAGRPELTPEAIRATEAEVVTGAEAVSLGFADEIGSFEDVVSMTIQELQGQKGVVMKPNRSSGKSSPADQKAQAKVRIAAEDPAAEEPAAEEACATCEAEGCSCGDTCTSKGCGCCDACAETEPDDEPDDETEPAATAASISGTKLPPAASSVATAQSRVDRLRAIRNRAAKTGDSETATEMDAAISELVSADVTALTGEAKRKSKMNATVALHLGAVLTRAITAGDKATESDLRAAIGAMGPEVPTDRLPRLKKVREAAGTNASEGVDDHDEVVQRLRAAGIQQGSAKWKATYPAELQRLRAERAS